MLTTFESDGVLRVAEFVYKRLVDSRIEASLLDAVEYLIQKTLHSKIALPRKRTTFSMQRCAKRKVSFQTSVNRMTVLGKFARKCGITRVSGLTRLF